MEESRHTPIEARQQDMMRRLLTVAVEGGDLTAGQQSFLERKIDGATTMGDLHDVLEDLDRYVPGAATRAVEATARASSTPTPLWKSLFLGRGLPVIALVGLVVVLSILDAFGIS